MPGTDQQDSDMRIDRSECHRLLAQARVAYLATTDSERQPHIVPITFAVVGSTLVTAIDNKPKTTTNLRRIRNITANPHVSVMVDQYDEDWSQLWWVRADGNARLIPSGSSDAVIWLTDKYPQYSRSLPDGPIIRITIDSITGWKHG